MADSSISGLYRIIPTYPVKPPQPADHEREGEDEKERREPPPPADDDDDSDDKPVIDEYV